MSQLVQSALRNSLGQVRHIRAISGNRAGGRVAEVYTRIERDFGALAPQLALHAPAPDTLAASWLMVRETLIAGDPAGRAAREAVATIVALGNSCRYCVDIHTATMDALGAARDADGTADPAHDLEIRRIADWARAARLRHTAGIPAPQGRSSELIGVLVAFQYLTRMANVFLPDSPLPATGRTRTSALLGRFLLPSATRFHPPGASLNLLPAAPLPADLAWAAENPAIAEAFARAAAVIDTAGARSVPEPVRAIVHNELSTWDGAAPGADRGWVAGPVATLPFTQRPVARLALLTAMAAHQVDTQIVEEARRALPGDAALVELTAWASMAAARLVGGWAAAARSGAFRVPEPAGR